VLDVSPVAAVLIRCFSEPACLDAFPAVEGAAACCIAPDELILIGPSHSTGMLMAEAIAYLENVDVSSFVIPHTDAWSFWALSGEDAGRAFMRLSANPLPRTVPAFIQGAIAQLPGKAFVLPECIVIIVPSTLGHHFPERVLAACADLTPKQGQSRPIPIKGGIRLRSARRVEV
jgi:hypothetical protein